MTGSPDKAHKGSPLENLLDFYIKHYKLITIVFIIVVLAVIVVLGWASAKEVRKVVVQDFNDQQLVLARHAAIQIENRLNTLKRELSLLSFSPAVQYSEAVQMGRRIGAALSSIKDDGCIEIRFVQEKRKKTFVVDPNVVREERFSESDLEYLEWAEWLENKGKIVMSEIKVLALGARERLILKMAMPVWQVSVDDAHPRATNEFAGVLIFIINATDLVDDVAASLKSGKTGYSWVIDNKGIFLYHPELDFIGKSAFEARRERKPTISFNRINEIQKEMILTGKEGASWYVSGWHKGQSGEMEKLIAYAPVRLNPSVNDLHWSVAVVAPTSEVDGVIRGIQTRQLLMEGIGVMATLGGGLLIVGILLRWSSTIKRQVDERTRELRRSEFHCRSLIEHAGDIIYTVSAEGVILSMNNYGVQFFKRGQDEIVGHPLTEIFPVESTALHLKEIKAVFERNISEQVTCPVTVNGGEYWLSINFSGLLDEWGNVYKVLGIARDITERKKIEQQMAHTEKLASVGTLAAGVAHEINNPLTIVLGFTDMLLEKCPEGTEEHELLKTIERQGLNAKRIVENLLGFARYTEHKEEDVDINANIESVIAVVANNLAIKKIQVATALADNLPIVKGDPGEIQQVLFNLISNAVAAMQGSGVLSIRSKYLGDVQQIEITVSDTGPGIAKEHRAKIFDPFFTTKKVGEGTGLGLSISYGIVSKHGGTISLETKTKDEAAETGTTFIITLPAVTTCKGGVYG